LTLEDAIIYELKDWIGRYGLVHNGRLISEFSLRGGTENSNLVAVRSSNRIQS